MGNDARAKGWRRNDLVERGWEVGAEVEGGICVVSQYFLSRAVSGMRTYIDLPSMVLIRAQLLCMVRGSRSDGDIVDGSRSTKNI